MNTARPSVEERFWEKVDKQGPTPAHQPELGPCWVWTKAIGTDGYGAFGVGRRTYKAHRAAWLLTFGPIPKGLCVLHRCDHRPCARPDHLFLGTRPDNTADMMAKGRHINPVAELNRAKTHCPRGHPYDEANTFHRRGERECRICMREQRRKT